MTKWIDIGPEKDLPPGGRLSATVEGHKVLVLNLHDKLVAVENQCTHAALPLDTGELAGCALTCLYHGFTFDVTTGKNVDDPQDTPLRTYHVKCEGGRVLVGIEPLF